ncbi:MAG: amylo-alpha-1,6-glucosidase, partial [Planctomycetota bacterium]|nr:amylo-alpha-1,6-glucosidase [Planctomycetota bacterium]
MKRRLRLRRNELSLSREWLETNARGGYASSTVLMQPTRRYHGLLVVPIEGSVKRHVFLTRFVEAVGGIELTPEFLTQFELGLWPVFRYRVGGTAVTREVLLVRGAATVLCRYRVDGPGGLELRPQVAFREADALTFANDALSDHVERCGSGIRVRPYDSLPAMQLTLAGGEHVFADDPCWERGIEYAADAARGYDSREDAWSPGVFTAETSDAVVVAATLGPAIDDAALLWASEAAARRARFAELYDGSLHGHLAVAAEDFLYEDPGGRTGVVAGWPWFLEWGRDTFIALPGLMLARDEQSPAKLRRCGDTLREAVPFLQRGLLPNIYGVSSADSHYGSVDAALWFARCVRLYQTAGGTSVHNGLATALEDIANAYLAGTDLGIECDTGCLIRAGSVDINPTWMDARTPDGPVTPRNGYPVEINALWYSLLAHLAELTGSDEWRRYARQAGESFVERFWLDEGYLADVWNEGAVDRSVRPNMVIAAALELSPLSQEQRASIVARAKAELLTPYGLRTLSPKSAAYVPRYAGDTVTRDYAYHQG